jgi:hypothetical protein
VRQHADRFSYLHSPAYSDECMLVTEREQKRPVSCLGLRWCRCFSSRAETSKTAMS